MRIAGVEGMFILMGHKEWVRARRSHQLGDIIMCHINTENIDFNALNRFQRDVLDISIGLLKNVDSSMLNGEIRVEHDIGVDFFIETKTIGFILYLSIRNEELIISSPHMDVCAYYYNSSLGVIFSLVEDVLKGKYKVILKFSKTEKLIAKEVKFNRKELEYFNYNQKTPLNFSKCYKIEEIEGEVLLKI